jgi:glycolate oxidase FAD binding subunit
VTAADELRPGERGDAIDGVIPGQVSEPGSAERFAAALGWASRERLATVLRGGGTKLGWGRVSPAVDLVLSTKRLDRLVAHRHGDMTATVEAGLPVASLNIDLARRGQCLPIDGAFGAATVGGVIATNDAGPLRHRYGTPRDLLLGVTLAMADGRLVRAGGTVVKNVAGYDLGRLVSGSCGCLAAIVEATFKLMPLPQASATLVATYGRVDVLAREAAAIGGSQLEPVAFDVRSSEATGHQLRLRFASSPAATEAQISAARKLLSGGVEIARGGDETALWDEQRREPWQGSGLVVSLSWLPARLDEVLTLVQGTALSSGLKASLVGRVAGAGLLRLEGEEDTHSAAIATLRASGVVGHVVVRRASPEVKRQIDVWGSTGSAASRALKQMFDPAGILGAGRGPV